jgi:hypothetical protein
LVVVNSWSSGKQNFGLRNRAAFHQQSDGKETVHGLQGLCGGFYLSLSVAIQALEFRKFIR